MTAWWLRAHHAADELVPDGLVGMGDEDWSLSPQVHCLDHMRRVLDGPGVSRLSVIPCGCCVRCHIEAAHRVGLGPRAAALVALQGYVWFPDPEHRVPGWRAARVAADVFVCQVQRARLDLVLTLLRPDPEAFDRRELMRHVWVLRARQESAWSAAAAAATAALRWVRRAQGGVPAEALEVAWRGFLASSVSAAGRMYDTPRHVSGALSAWRAN